MKLIYFKGSRPNFGDDLNAILWPQLIPEFFDEDGDEGFLGIGTIIGMRFAPVKKLHVFSSGVGYDSIEFGADLRKVWCVRGPYSAKHLGLEPRHALTDGGILAPLILKKPDQPANDICVVPHWETLSEGDWGLACRLAGMRLVNPMQEASVAVESIISARLVLTESLHGAIIADAYGIPWIPFTTTSNFSLFKWRDWTSSVQIRLRLGHVPPPSGGALIRFGYPLSGKWGDFKEVDERLILAESERRLSANKEEHKSLESTHLKKFLKEKVLLNSLLASTLSISAESCAKGLQKLSRQEPFLSYSSIRETLTSEMLDRLEELARTQGRHVKI